MSASVLCVSSLSGRLCGWNAHEWWNRRVTTRWSNKECQTHCDQRCDVSRVRRFHWSRWLAKHAGTWLIERHFGLCNRIQGPACATESVWNMLVNGACDPHSIDFSSLPAIFGSDRLSSGSSGPWIQLHKPKCRSRIQVSACLSICYLLPSRSWQLHWALAFWWSISKTRQWFYNDISFSA